MKRPLTLGLAKAGQGKPEPMIWWKLDETQGAVAANSAGTGFAGKVVGEPKWSSDAVTEGALEFDGKVNRVEAADSAGADFQTGLTAAAWFKVRKFKAPGEAVVSKGTAWRIQRQGRKGALEFVARGLAPTGTGTNAVPMPMFRTKKAVNDGQWHHVAATWDGKQVAFYLDGEEQVTALMTGSLVANNVPIVAGDNHEVRGRNFNGWMDDVRVYQRGLSAQEIRDIVAKGKKLVQK